MSERKIEFVETIISRVLINTGIVVGAFLIVFAAAWIYIVQPLRCRPDCIGANLLSANLKGMEIQGINLMDATLDGANLARTDLRGADLSNATMSRANLEGADLRGALLLGANLREANLNGAMVTGADFSGADLTLANLTGIDLTQVDLNGVNLDRAILIDVDLRQARLAGTEMSQVQMKGANLAGADLSGAHLSQANLSGAQLIQTNLSGAELNIANLNGADLGRADLSGSSLIGANLASANMEGARLNSALLVGATMQGANLRGANLNAAVILVKALDLAALTRDPIMQALNELQRSQILVDTDLDGMDTDERTIWPNPELTAKITAENTAQEMVVLTDQEIIKVGLLYSVSGGMAAQEASQLNAVLLAMQEINDSGGLLGRRLTPIVEDLGSQPGLYAPKAEQMLTQNQVEVIFGCVSPGCRQTILPILQANNGLLFYPATYEGFEESRFVFYTGLVPNQQALPALDYLLDHELTNIFLLGSDTAFSRGVNAILKARLAAAELTVSGEIYIPSGETDFAQFIVDLQGYQPQVVLSSLEAASNTAFFQQMKAADISANQLPVMNITLTEREVQSVGAPNMVGHFMSWHYFQTTESPTNASFVAAYRRAYGADQPVTADVEMNYASVYLWKALVETADSTGAASVRQAAKGETPIEIQAPSGPVQIDGKSNHVYRVARIGEIQDNGLVTELWRSEDVIAPDPFLTGFRWATDLAAQFKTE